jgi:5'-nucleotidase
MFVMTWSAIIGTLAALCTTLAFLPPLLKVKRQGGTDPSWSMLSMYLAGQFLWFGYGLVNDAGAVIAANVAAIVLVSAIVVMKVSPHRRPVRRRLRIAIDMDEVMADSLAEHVRRYNAAFGAQLAIRELRGRSLEEHVPPAHREAAEALLDASFFRDLTVLTDCQDVIRDLAGRHDVFIATAAMEVPVSFDAKYQWLREHFPFIPPSHFVFCGDKSVIDADYLIDDRARHFTRFKGRPLLFSAPHNADETRYPRVASWAEIRELFAKVDGALDSGHDTAPSPRWLRPRERRL